MTATVSGSLNQGIFPRSYGVATAKATAKVIRKVSPTTDEKAYFDDLHGILDEVYALAKEQYKWTWTEFAKTANVSPLCVNNLGNRITKYPLFRTVYKLSRAVGMELELQTAVPIRQRRRKAG
jgi:hypothetical protein